MPSIQAGELHNSYANHIKLNSVKKKKEQIIKHKSIKKANFGRKKHKIITL